MNHDDCGCCVAPDLLRLRDEAPPRTPLNRPLLPAVAFRIGTFSTFRESLLLRLVGQDDLRALRTRASDDHAITLLELWAVVADVLTFYQERIANESFLRTARLRDSVARLVRLIDYELRPGVAATARVAFTIERFEAMRLAKGLRIQSVPGPDEKPQKYETLEPVDARLALNRVPVFGALVPDKPFSAGSTGGTVVTGGKDLTAGSALLLFDETHTERKTVDAVTRGDGLVELLWAPAVTSTDFSDDTTRLVQERRTMRLFGHNAPESYMVVVKAENAPGGFKSELKQLQSSDFELKGTGSGITSLVLDAAYPDLAAGTLVVVEQDRPSTSAPGGFVRLARVREVTTGEERIPPGAVAGDDVGTATKVPAMAGTATRIELDVGFPWPPVIALANQRLHVFAISDDEALWLLRESVPGGAFEPWISLGGRLADFVVQRLADRLLVIGRGTDGRLFSMLQSAPGQGWGGWTPLGGTSKRLHLAAPDPRDASGSAVVVALASDGTVSTNAFHGVTGKWTGWVDLGGDIDQVLLATGGKGSDQRLFIAGRALDRTLTYRLQSSAVAAAAAGGTSAWDPWKSRAGAIDELLAVATDGNGAVEVFARGVDRKLTHIACPKGQDFGAWQSLGGEDVLTARVVGDSTGHLNAFVLSPAKQLSKTAQTGAGATFAWPGGWTTLTGFQPEVFEPAVGPGGVLQVFAAAATTNVKRYTEATAWSNTLLGITGVDLLRVGAAASGRLLLLARREAPGGPSALWWFRGPSNSASAWNGVWASAGPPMLAIKDLRQIVVHELAGEPIPLSSFRYPETISGTSLDVPLRFLDAIDPKRTIILDDAAGKPIQATVLRAAPVDADLDTVSDHLRITLTAPLSRTLDASTAVLLGNVGLTSHGESVRSEVIGDGDASIPFQRFVLAKTPVTHLVGAGGLDSELAVSVNGIDWKEVPTLYGQPATAQVYTTKLRDDGGLVVQFGDGEHGARPPSGARNIVARYRQGSGLVGRVRAGTLRNLLDRPVGLAAATNPLPADGGADPERPEEAKRNAPARVRTFDRVVSLRDIEDLVTESGEIVRVSATLVWDGDAQAVHLTVAGAGGAVPGAGAVSRLVARLATRRDPTRVLLVAPFVAVPIVLGATLRVDDRHEAARVEAEARAAMTRALAFDALAFGQSLNLSDVYAVLQGVEGVESVDIDVLQFKGYQVWTATERLARGVTGGPLQSRLRIFPARPRRPPQRGALPAEQAILENATTDLTLATTGGLPS